MGYKVFRILFLAFVLHLLPANSGIGVSLATFALADDDHDDHDSDDSDSDDDHQDSSSSSNRGSGANGDLDSDSDDTLNRVRDGVRGDALMPLWMIKARVVAQFGHKIIGIEIDEKKQTWIYEFKVVDRNGRLLEVYVNAKDGSIIEVKNDE